MQAEEDYEALASKAKEGDVDAIEEWLSSLERDPNGRRRRTTAVFAQDTLQLSGRGGSPRACSSV